jgi:hypothetical protein
MTVGEQTLEFSGAKVIRANLVEEFNPLSVEVPISTCEFSVISTDESFSMFSGSIFSLLSERLPFLLYERIDAANVFQNKFYLGRPDGSPGWRNVSEHEFEFSGIDLVGVMALTPFDGIFWGSDITLAFALAEILTPASFPYTLDASLANVQISGWIAPGTYRDALRQMLFAAGATVTTARSQRLLINPVSLPDKIPTLVIGNSEKTENQPVELRPLVTSVELVSHNYSQSDESEVIFDEFLDPGEYKVVFPRPYYNITIDGPGYVPDLRITGAGDFRVTGAGDFRQAGGEFSFGPNSVFLSVQEAGQVTITGFPWVDSQRSFTFTETGVTEYNNKNPLKIEGATLINTGRAPEILEQVRDYYRQRYLQTITLFPSDVKPRDIVLTSSLFGKRVLGSVRKMDMDLSGGFLGKTQLVGIEPEYYPPIANPVRRRRTGVWIAGTDLTRQNMFREYQH